LSAAWPETARDVKRYLQRRGVPTGAADDILQEVALRVLRSDVAFEGSEDLVPWACVVAWRIYVDECRKTTRRRSADEPIGDIPSGESVEDTAVARIRLAEVARAMSTLSGRDQSALLAALCGRRHWSDGQAAQRAAVVRHRARLRLLQRLASELARPPAA
jgi:DNA-directed RNA polymerase specialized sigma24 family protein